MSQSTSIGPTEAQFLEEITSLWAPMTQQNYVIVSSFAFMIYEYFLTLPLEVSEIWQQRRMSLTKIIFLCNRYPQMIAQLCLLLFSVWANTDNVCKDLEFFGNSLSPLVGLAQFSMFALRTFALYQRNWIILLLLGSITLAYVAVSIGLQIGTTSQTTFNVIGVPMPVTCLSESNNDSIDKWELAQFILNFVFDTVVFGLTLGRTIGLAIQARQGHMKNSLGILLLLDGIIFYFFVCVPSIVGMALFGLTIQQDSSQSINDAEANFSFYYNVIVWSMTNRLILNLCQTAHNPLANDSFTATARSFVPEINFATNSVLGNIGAPLRIDNDDDDDTLASLASDETEMTRRYSKYVSSIGGD